MLKKILFPIAFCVSALSILSMATATAAPSVLPIEQWQLANGTRVYYVHFQEIPMVDINVVFDAGSARDGKAFGLGTFTNSAFAEGTGNLNADEVAEQFATLGAIINNRTSRDMAIVHLRSLTKKDLLDPSVDLFSHLLNAPKLQTKNYDRIKNQLLQGIKQQDETPSSIATVALFKKMYGDMPYGHSSLGTAQTVANITPQQIADFYKCYYVGHNAMVVIVGDVDRKQAMAIAQKTAGQLPPGQTPAALPTLTSLPATQTIAINYPSNQSAIKLGQVGITWKDPDYFNLLVGNYILGGGPLTSRLFLEVRQQRGLTYSVNSGFYPLKDKGPFLVALQTKNEDRQKALDVIANVLGQFVTLGPTEQELEMAKKHIVGNFPLTIDDNSSIAEKLILMGFYQLPSDYLDTYRQQVQQVNANGIKTAFQKFVRPEQLITVTVGPSMGSEQYAEKN